MSHDLYTYGELNPIAFVLTLDGEGVPGETLEDADVQLSSIDDGTPTYNTSVNIGLECSSGDNGFYYWTPTDPAQTQHDVLLIYINDSSGTPQFDENRLVICTGGNASARFSG